jgi:hypothetical protein
VLLAGVISAWGCGAPTSGLSPGPGAGGPDASGEGSWGAGADAATSCRGSDVSTYLPARYQPAAEPSAACLGADGGTIWDAYFDACLAPGTTKEACASFTATPANAACAACVLTSYTSDPLGPIIDYGDFVGPNVAGCIELEAPRELACAKAVQALTGCEIAACQANCPVVNEPSLMAREACAMDADDAGCLSFSQAASACRASEADAGLADPCMITAFKDFYDSVVPLFCGQVPGDASAGSDASFTDSALTPASDASAGTDGRASAAPADAGAE